MGLPNALDTGRPSKTQLESAAKHHCFGAHFQMESNSISKYILTQ